MLVSSYTAKYYRDAIKVVATKIDIDNFDTRYIDRTKKEISNNRVNHLSCVSNFKEKFAYNFNKLDNLLFCTLTIATYDNPIIPDTRSQCMLLEALHHFQ